MRWKPGATSRRCGRSRRWHARSTWSWRRWCGTWPGGPTPIPGATLGERVAQRRLALGYGRQADLASAAGVPRATLNQVERGGIPNPKLSLLVRLAAALQCCPSELVRGLDARGADGGRGASEEMR